MTKIAFDTEKAGEPTIGEWNNNVVIVLAPESKYPFQFGLSKAKMIMDNIKAIEKFVETGGKRVK